MNYMVELRQRRWLSAKAFEIELSRPTAFEFKAGQTILLIHANNARHYNLVSTPNDPYLETCVRLVRQGALSPILATAEIGSTFEFSGPYGYFTFNSSAHPAVFVASGTGIAPFVCMGRSGVKNFILLHEARSAEELYYQSLFREIASQYVPCVLEAPPADLELAGAFHGPVAEFVRDRLPPANYDFYLCGRRGMVREVTLLIDARFPASRVYTEIFD
ncbi:MAG: hypothetical protein JSW39_29720 [Desulfobacterales bacterium]|nr:MAG: hypothetical protein JSW39_29720 [Desulfobacterales bacterium]